MHDPMEQIIADALDLAGIAYQTGEGGGTEHGLDFHLPEQDVAIEVKRFHSPRISDQMSRYSDVIAVQGEKAVRMLAGLIERMDKEAIA